MCEGIGLFQVRICLKEDLRSLSLCFCPFVRGLEEQVSAACQQLPVRVPIGKYGGSVCYPQIPGFFPGLRVSLDGIPSVGDAHLLQGITGKLLYVEAVYGPHGIGEATLGYEPHGARHIHGNLPDHKSLVLVNAHKGLYNNISGHTSDHGDDSTFPSTGRPVGHNRIKLTVAWDRLVNADAFSHVLGEDKPLLRMGELLPFTIATEYFLVLLLKCVAVDVVIEVKRTGGRRNRLHTVLLYNQLHKAS